MRKIASVERVEFSSHEELKSVSGNYYVVPVSIILNQDMDEKRVSVFSFFSVSRGLDYQIKNFSIHNIVEWLRKKPDRHAGAINDKIYNVICELGDDGYLKFIGNIAKSSNMTAEFNMEKISEECKYNRFAIIYVDELQKILNYKNPNPKETFSNIDTILLVFAYLRMRIHRRRNSLLPEEINTGKIKSHENDIKARRLRYPEAYNCFYSDIADELGLSSRVVSKAVGILQELGLIYYETLPRIKIQNTWRTDHTIFCNMYKREDCFLLASGSSYYLEEIKNKKKKLKI